MEESKNLEQNLDKSNEKLHISDDDDTFDQLDDLTDYDDELDGKIEKFFKNEVCPYLTYSF